MMTTTDLHNRIEQLETELESIRLRNSRVEFDKAWETSKIRVAAICIITYLCAALLMFMLGSEQFWLNALVPVMGYYLSSQSLPSIKRWWLRSVYRGQ